MVAIFVIRLSLDVTILEPKGALPIIAFKTCDDHVLFHESDFLDGNDGGYPFYLNDQGGSVYTVC